MKGILLVALILAVVLAVLLVIQTGRLAATKRENRDLKKTLDGVKDPMVWLSDEDRRTHALDLLAREKAEYQEFLTEKQLAQVKQFNTPTMEEGK